MNKNDQEFLFQKIRTQYTEKEHTHLEALKELDEKVKRPANTFAYIFGSFSAIVMGSGMSLVMTDIGAALGMSNTMVLGTIIGIAGMLMAIINYPIYKGIVRLCFSENILKNLKRKQNFNIWVLSYQNE